MLKHRLTIWTTAATLGVGQALAQDPPPPPPVPVAPAPTAPYHPAPPTPPRPEPPGVPGRRAGHRAEPTTFLGVGVEALPDWLGEQLSLPNGFGLLVTYVTPGSPAEAAGVKTHDILKQINDQMLVNSEQLSSLVQSMPEGQTVALTVLRKGQEAKLSAKLERKPLWTPDMTVMDAAGAADDFQRFNQPPTREILDQLGPEVRRAIQDAGRKAADQARREIMILRDKNGKSSTTKMDLSEGHIVLKDDQGELVIDGDGKNGHVVAKDAAGRKVYIGPAINAPAGLLDRLGRFGKGKIEINGDEIRIGGGEDPASEPKDDQEDKALSPTPSPSPSLSPVPAGSPAA